MPSSRALWYGGSRAFRLCAGIGRWNLFQRWGSILLALGSVTARKGKLMRRRLSPWLVLLVCVPGCIGRDRLNADCGWTHDAARPLNLRSHTDRQHLVDDTEVAEEIGIRYGDSFRKREGLEAEHRRTDQCTMALFAEIASIHGITVNDVREARGGRHPSFDVAVIVSFAALYGLVSSRVARWMMHRPSVDARWPILVATLATSAALSTGGLLVGEVWSGIAESIRVGNAHMSYRVPRIPWHQHRSELFVAGVLLFWVIALLHYWLGSHKNEFADSRAMRALADIGSPSPRR
jgi:hypothetical protein